MDIKRALVTVQLSDTGMRQIYKALAPAEIITLDPKDIEGLKRCCESVDVAILNSDCPIPVSFFKNLRWMHCSHAGVDKTVSEEFFSRNIVLTCAKGRSAQALAEHSFMFMLHYTYNVREVMRRQHDHLWCQDHLYPSGTGLSGKILGVVGLGNTGMEVARLGKAFGMHVLGYRRSQEKPEWVDELYTSNQPDSLCSMLTRCDYIVLCIELNQQTLHLIGAAELAAMKQTAFLVNMGRGGLVDEACLIDALRSGQIGGAGLDTVTVEPLSPQSPLWDFENVLITPHVTPAQSDKEERMLSYILHNIHAYRTNGTFVNRVQPSSILGKCR